jgi:hypothetical protein
MTEQTTESQTQARCFVCEATGVMGRIFRQMGPSEEARTHFRQSRIEFLKGIRRVLDDRIDNLNRSGEHRGTRVTVD